MLLKTILTAITPMLLLFQPTLKAFTTVGNHKSCRIVCHNLISLPFQRSRVHSDSNYQGSVHLAFEADSIPSESSESIESGRKRKEKRKRSKPELVSSPQRPAIVPLKFSNVKSADILDLTELDFDTIIDVRTPAEFEIDHIPGSVNYPVLDNEERIIIGTLHNGNVFEARRRGAAMISRHVASLLENEFQDQPKSWRPLIYCWRGGMRSGSLAIVLAQVGWQVHQLNGGYKSYRRNLMDLLPVLCSKSILKIVSAPTGSGKTHFLAALERAGKQVIDLEDLACHRGSVLGNIPGESQPSQRMFDSRLLLVMQKMDLSKPIYIESESRKIGSITLPDALSDRMHESECLYLEVPEEERVKGLCVDYKYYIDNPEILIKHLGYLSDIRGKEQLDKWSTLVREGRFPELVQQLLSIHYDPLYWKSLRKNYPQIDDRAVSQQLTVTSISPSSLDEAVTRIIEKDYSV
jgi:tRNA 2-selenouridine synthase